MTFYARHFNTVEINYFFYHIPPEKSVKKWTEIEGDFGGEVVPNCLF
ncbi:MAG TPA: DUF72 domain-containing protein [Bacteroidetes bacterium]|nr:DUF72 domain-containing protein [Bacteroidota bacterium]